jgi:AmmeMemoRadiSam system protein A
MGNARKSWFRPPQNDKLPGMVITEPHQQVLLEAARAGIRNELRGVWQHHVPAADDPLFLTPAGCFVTLHDRLSHRLRGCVGRLQSPDPLLRTVYETARSVVHDHRFASHPVTLAELPRLELEISVLSPLKPADGPLDFDPPNDGIYLVCEGRTGTFLPSVARETGWTREQLLCRLCTEKMGLQAYAWRDVEARLMTYRTVIIGPAPFGEVEAAVAAAEQEVPLAYPPILAAGSFQRPGGGRS